MLYINRVRLDMRKVLEDVGFKLIVLTGFSRENEGIFPEFCVRFDFMALSVFLLFMARLPNSI